MESNYILPFLLAGNYYKERKKKPEAQYWLDQSYMIAERSNMKTKLEMLIKSNDITRKSFVKTDIDVKYWDKSMQKVMDNVFAHEVDSNCRLEVLIKLIGKEAVNDR